MGETVHTLLSPSAGARWSRCSMAPHEEAKYPDKPSAASQMGTNAHTAWETWLQGGNPADHPFCDDEMFSNLAPGVQYLTNRCNQTGMQVTGIEQRVDVGVALGFLPGVINGTLDTALSSNELIEILDLKYGVGPVEPENNEQLILYLAGLLGDKLWFMPADYPVRLSIFQPRATDGRILRHWDTNLEVIRKHVQHLSEAANKCYTAPEFNPGEIQCQWCNARNDCAARREKNVATIEQAFRPVAEGMARGEKPAGNTLASLMYLIPEMENWIRDIRKEAYTQAQAGQLPGWKLIQGRKTRTWSEPDDALGKIQRWRINGKALGLDVARPRGAISPAQAEKIPGLSDKQKTLLVEMIAVTYGAPKLVPEADPHPAITVDAEQYFGKTEEVS